MIHDSYKIHIAFVDYLFIYLFIFYWQFLTFSIFNMSNKQTVEDIKRIFISVEKTKEKEKI